LDIQPLSNYEILFAFYETGHLISESMALVMTVLAGFMVAGVFFGQVLDRIMTALLVGVYSLFYLFTAFTLVRQAHAYGGLMEVIRERNAEGTDFSWHGGVNIPDTVVAVGIWPLSFVLTVAFAGSLVFFFRTRQLDPKSFR